MVFRVSGYTLKVCVCVCVVNILQTLGFNGENTFLLVTLFVVLPRAYEIVVHYGGSASRTLLNS